MHYAVTAHYMSLHAAIKMLHSRLFVLHSLLRKIIAGQLVSLLQTGNQLGSSKISIPAHHCASHHRFAVINDI